MRGRNRLAEAFASPCNRRRDLSGVFKVNHLAHLAASECPPVKLFLFDAFARFPDGVFESDVADDVLSAVHEVERTKVMKLDAAADRCKESRHAFATLYCGVPWNIFLRAVEAP